MSVFERMEMKKKRPIPNYAIMVLLLMMVFGVYLRSCWKEKQVHQIEIANIEIVDHTNASIDIQFSANNPYKVPLKKSILIKVILTSGADLASRLTSIEFPPNSNKKYLKILNRFAKPLTSLDEISKVTVEIYNP